MSADAAQDFIEELNLFDRVAVCERRRQLRRFPGDPTVASVAASTYGRRAGRYGYVKFLGKMAGEIFPKLNPLSPCELLCG